MKTHSNGSGAFDGAPEALKQKTADDYHNPKARVFGSRESPLERLLSRLDKVKQTGPGRWLACCPAHDDRTPSLATRELDGGTLLVHCFSGCSTHEVLVSIGLTFSDLFPESSKHDYKKSLRPGERWIPRDVLTAVAREALLVALASEMIQRGETLQPGDKRRLETACSRLRAAATEVGA